MKSRDWNKVKELFALALEQPAEAQENFLRRSCGANDTIFREVQSLLRAHAEPENVVEKNAFQFASLLELKTPDYSGRAFGNYRIIREIGRGGMGMVYLAARDDGEFEQHVALKIVRQTFIDPKIAVRFRRERQILASLNHPNIARLLDGGVSASDEPFFAMEYIKGERLTDYAARLNLSLEERLKLFLKVCAALAYAHRNLIIHRDIKPSNIMVDEQGEVKLLDFGLAQILKDNLLEFEASQTETNFRAFTPAYASPEQIQGKRVTTTTDIYSLGVVLYELLTGARPNKYDNQNFDEIIRSAQSLEPPPAPSAVISERWMATSETSINRPAKTVNENAKLSLPTINSKFLKGDLDNIALMALRKEPDRRYESVERFAQDIERHLNNLPVMARPDTLSYRTIKFWKRNTLAVSAVGFILLALAVGLTVTLWQMQIARQQALRAEQRFQDVRKLSNSLLFEITPKIERLPGSTEAREILVERALEYLDSLANESQNDSALQSELASAYEKIGELQGNPNKPNLSDFSGAKNSFEKARGIRRLLLEKNPADFDNRTLLAANENALSQIEYWAGSPAESVKDSDAALNLYEQLLAEEPSSLKLKLALADASYSRANFLYVNNRLPESYPYLKKTIAALEELSAQNPADTEIQRLLAKGYRQLGATLSWDLKQSAAEAEMSKAITLNEQLAKNYPNDVLLKQELGKTYGEAGSIYEEIDNSLALKFSEKALIVARDMAQKDTADLQAQNNLASEYLRVGEIFNQLKDFRQAENNLQNSLTIFEGLEKLEPKNVTYKTLIGTVYTQLGEAKTTAGDYAGAITEYEKSAAFFQAVIEKQGDESRGELRHLALAYTYIGEAYEKSGKNADMAKLNFRRSLDFYNQLETRTALTEYDKQRFEVLKKKVK